MNQEINWSRIEKIFFVGIKGVGMMPLSIMCKEAGFSVAGADIAEEFITDEVLKEKEIEVFEDFKEEAIESFFSDTPINSSLVITTGAHSGYKNPLVQWAASHSIPVLNQGQALGIFMTGKPFGKEIEGITVTGSHGKTTISAMLANAFSYLKLDPTFCVGTSRIFPIGASGHYGKGKYFIAEGDEYVGEPVFDKTPKILYQKPKMAIINNIDFDHPDIYKDLSHVKETVLEFINNMIPNGKVFLNTGDENTRSIRDRVRKDLEVVTYGGKDADYSISEIKTNSGFVEFIVKKSGNPFGQFRISIPASHNAHNSLAVIALLDQIGIDIELVKNAVTSYAGCRRRMELVGNTEKKVLIVDDYGHHPAEIKSTIQALKEFYGRKIICVFQSHTYSRTKNLWNEFISSFEGIDELVLLPIFRSQRDTEKDNISNEDFANDLRKKVNHVFLASGINEAVEYLKKTKQNDSFLILTIGAGDVYKVGYKLKE